MSGDTAHNVLRRREILTKLALGSLAFSGLALLLGSFRFAFPRILSSDRKIRAGRGVDFPVGLATFVEQGECYVLRNRNGIRVISATCPHLGCVVQRTDSGFRCPCHGSEFGPAGDRLSGPAPHALKRLRVELLARGELEVDLAQPVPVNDPPLRLPSQSR